MKLSIAGLLLALFVFPSYALAQREDQFVWGIGGGATFPAGYAEDNHKTGAHGLALFGIGSVDSPFGIRFDGLYTSLGDGNSNGLPVNQGEARVFSIMGNGLVSIYGSNRRIYAIGGIGGFWYNPDGQGTSSVNDFVMGGGLGIWMPRINGFLEARWLNMYRALPDPVTGLKGKKSAQLYPVTLGIIF